MSAAENALRPSPVKPFLKKPIAFYDIFSRVGGSINAGLFLSQAYYWSSRTKDPDGWFYKKCEEWEQETSLSRWEQESVRVTLKDAGLIEEKKQGVPCRLHFRINETALVEALTAYTSGSEPPSTDPHEAAIAYLKVNQAKIKRLAKIAHKRAVEKGAKAELVDYAKVLSRDGLICHICGKSIQEKAGAKGNELQFDHVVPLSTGGTHTFDNIKTGHSSCIRAKYPSLVKAPDTPDNSQFVDLSQTEDVDLSQTPASRSITNQNVDLSQTVMQIHHEQERDRSTNYLYGTENTTENTQRLLSEITMDREKERKVVQPVSKVSVSEEEEDAWNDPVVVPDPEVAKHLSLGKQTQQNTVSQEVQSSVETKCSAAAPDVTKDDKVKHVEVEVVEAGVEAVKEAAPSQEQTKTTTPRNPRNRRHKLNYDREVQRKRMELVRELKLDGSSFIKEDLRNLADYEMGDIVELYRASGVIIWSEEDDISEEFLKYWVKSEFGYPTTIQHAFNLLQGYEKNPVDGWPRIQHKVKEWQRKVNNPEVAIAEAESNIGKKKDRVSDFDRELNNKVMAAKLVRATQSISQPAQPVSATQQPQEAASTQPASSIYDQHLQEQLEEYRKRKEQEAMRAKWKAEDDAKRAAADQREKELQLSRNGNVVGAATNSDYPLGKGEPPSEETRKKIEEILAAAKDKQKQKRISKQLGLQTFD